MSLTAALCRERGRRRAGMGMDGAASRTEQKAWGEGEGVRCLLSSYRPVCQISRGSGES